MMFRIKSFHTFIDEAISFRDARKATEIFLNSDGKNRYNEVFQGKDRIYYDFIQDSNLTSLKSELQKKIENVLSKNGYYVADYIKGIATKEGDQKNVFKIQKLLVKFGETQLRNEMDADPTRFSAKKADKKIVISRHGIDIAGQTSGRDWVSCKTVSNGVKTKYVWSEIEKGSLVAYLIESNDLNIQNPIARILIGVYINEEDPADFVLYPDSSVYGNYKNPDFMRFVTNWCNEANEKVSKNYKGIYKLSPMCAADNSLPITILSGSITLKQFYEGIYKNGLNYLSADQRGLVKPGAKFYPEEIKGMIPFITENGIQPPGDFIKDVKSYCSEKVFAAVVDLNTKEEILKQMKENFKTFTSYLINVSDLNSFEDKDKVKMIKEASIRISSGEDDLQKGIDILNYSLNNLNVSSGGSKIIRWLIS